MSDKEMTFSVPISKIQCKIKALEDLIELTCEHDSLEMSRLRVKLYSQLKVLKGLAVLG